MRIQGNNNVIIRQQQMKGCLWSRKKSIHSGVKVPGNQCDYEATTKASFLKHLNSIHEFPYEKYQYLANEKRSLFRQIKSIHRGVKLILCQIIKYELGELKLCQIIKYELG